MDYLGVFAKFWQPGQVKTRLAAAIGAQRASDLHQSFVATLLKRFERSADQRVLCYTPKQRQQSFGELAGDRWMLWPQTAGDLGDRMRAFFEQAFQHGAHRVVLIGSDSPTLPAEFVQQAFDSLSNQQVVLGPTSDGGYYLVGASRPTPAMFANIPWSTDQVLSRTIQALNEQGVAHALLPEWYDVDEWSDLKRLAVELQQLPREQSVWKPLRKLVAEVVDGQH